MNRSPNFDVRIVILDDNAESVELMSRALAQEGVEILSTTDPEEGMDLIFEQHPQIVLTDLVMPKLSGLQVLERIMYFDPSIDVILMTAHYSTESAVDAIRKGATDYLNKPVPVAVIRDRMKKLIDNARHRLRALALEQELLETSRFNGLIGRSPGMLELFSTVRRVAPHYRSLLITGQTGTGKDLVAQAVHALSPVASGNLVVVNCSAVVETLFESELFGHVKGAFTGADRDKVGLAEHASGGALFLDEIGDMPMSTQAKLLRVLQNQEVQRVGSLYPRKVDLRVIAATNRDLRAAIQERSFREELYYRLTMIEVHVPRLAERPEDIPLLTHHFIAKFSRQFNKVVHGLTRRAQIVISRHGWPGNVRELENVVGHACILVMGDTIDVIDLPGYLWNSAEEGPVTGSEALPIRIAESLEDHERTLVADALQRAGGNQSEAARQLRIGRDALRYKMKKHNFS
ncbi:MAG: sigma-54-dependent Fis family transcriptional regulator [Bryobacteraceae bacterium]|nr:sigma-54-dependent Fis family transcriptional regulator [Bryobacteraceae bacterium]